MRSDIVPGSHFPITSCPTTRVRSASSANCRAMTRSFSRWPAATIAQGTSTTFGIGLFYPKIAVAYTQIVTISTDDHHTLQEFRESVGAQWTFLSDPERKIQKDIDIQEYTDPSTIL